jgi:hypothetical protein
VTATLTDPPTRDAPSFDWLDAPDWNALRLSLSSAGKGKSSREKPYAASFPQNYVDPMGLSITSDSTVNGFLQQIRVMSPQGEIMYQALKNSTQNWTIEVGDFTNLGGHRAGTARQKGGFLTEIQKPKDWASWDCGKKRAYLLSATATELAQAYAQLLGFTPDPKSPTFMDQEFSANLFAARTLEADPASKQYLLENNGGSIDQPLWAGVDQGRTADSLRILFNYLVVTGNVGHW